MIQHLYLDHSVSMMEQEALEAARSPREVLMRLKHCVIIGDSYLVWCHPMNWVTGVMTSKEYSGDVSYAHYPELTEHIVAYCTLVTETHNCVTDTPSGSDNDLFYQDNTSSHDATSWYLLTLDHVSPHDKARLLESLALGHMMVRHTHHIALRLYEQALKKWEGLNGNLHPLVAHVTKEIANVYSIMDQPDKSLNLLEKAVDIYKQKQQLLTNKQLFQQAECFSSLAIICGNLGDKKRARKSIKDALALYEKVTIATEGNISNHYKYQIASLMTDLGHVLLHLGQLPLAKKYLDMAYMSRRNLHGDSHSEVTVARCVNVQSMMYALLEDGEKSKRLRQEAALINNKLKIIPLL